VRGDMVADTFNSIMINFSTYPDGIFKGVVRLILYTIVPVGLTVYLPVKIILHFNFLSMLMVTGFAVFIILLAFIVFYQGLKRYSSSNLMSARI
ncbi:MAG TPA: ABC-2 family transporter protein, partial [Mobilitalea sp.]|nr:ABC-2 family transporter protein [Mobilitalea sp.]